MENIYDKHIKNVKQVKATEMRKGLKSKKYFEQAIDLSVILNESENKGKILLPIKYLFTIIKGMIAESKEIHTRKKYISKIFGCSLNQIAGDINEYMALKENALYYAGDFSYSAIVDKEWLTSLKFIWGDAHLEALDDIQKMSSIEFIAGDVYYQNNIYSFEDFKGKIAEKQKGIKEIY